MEGDTDDGGIPGREGGVSEFRSYDGGAKSRRSFGVTTEFRSHDGVAGSRRGCGVTEAPQADAGPWPGGPGSSVGRRPGHGPAGEGRALEQGPRHLCSGETVEWGRLDRP